MSSDPTTLLDVLGVVSPVIAAGIAVGGVIGTIIFTNIRERDRQTHELKKLEREIEERRWSTLRGERREAYMAYLAVCDRLHGGDHSPEARAELRKITVVVELVSLSEEVQDSVRVLTNHLILRAAKGETETVSSQDESAYRALLGKFREAVQRDLGITPAARQSAA